MSSYDELDQINKRNLEYNKKITPDYDIEWEDVDVEYKYDDPGEAPRIRDIKYDDNSGLYKSVVSDIKYDDNSNLYADDTYINKSITNWQYIEENR